MSAPPPSPHETGSQAHLPFAAAGTPSQHGHPPQAPALSPAAARAAADRRTYLGDREAVERRSIWRGLLVLALLALLFSFWRAGLSRVFLPGWWRQW